MNYRLIILFPLLLLAFPQDMLYGGPGDTLVVQTFTWDSPVNPGWNQPKEGRFFFPTADRQWERVLMYYTLKCDPSQNPPCGEWDYLTYARLYEHTGRYDSNQVTHPNFLAFGLAPDTLEYMHAPSPRFLPRIEQRIVHDDTLTMHTTAIGNGTMGIDIRPVSTTMDMRSYMIWTSEELSAAGLRAEALTGLRLHVGDVDGTLHRVTIRLRRFTGAGWSDAIPLRDVGFVTVYDAALTLTPQSWNSIQFTTPFTYWSGSILAEFTIDRIDGSGFTLLGDPTAEAALFTSMEADELLYVQPRSHVRCGPIEDLNDTETLTLEAWINPETLQNWTNIVMKGVSNEHRIGIQLNPPDGGKSDVFCLVGNGSNSYGRTQNRPVNTNSWMHVAMVYDGSAPSQEQRLRLYINGEAQTLDFNGSIPERTTSNDAPFVIATDGGSYFNGWMDEVRIWRAALSGEEIRERLHAHIDAGDPLYPSLISAWSFDEGTGNMAYDRTGAHDGRLLFPQRQSWQGRRVRGFQPASFRPAVIFEQGSFTSRTEETLVVDTLTTPPIMVVRFDDTTRANVPTDTMYVWPTYATYTFDANGNAVDSTRIPADGSLLREDHFYYQTPYEILNRYELGRYITPYGIGLDLGEGWTWVYDVTDFLPLLKDSVHLTAGNFQELLDMKFIFIEGTPPRDVKRIRNLWQGNFLLKDFQTRVQPLTLQLHPDAEMFKVRTTVTGHDFNNPTNCAEFCPKIHTVSVNGQTVRQWQIMQECSSNPLYPQGGTWVYARSGWCPGMEGRTQEIDITPWVDGNEATVHYASQYDEYGNYVMESQLVSYGAPNHQLDAAVDGILVPNDYELHGRFNPSCGMPRIVIQNRGAEPLTSLDIRYGFRGTPPSVYRWTGQMEFLQKDTVDLPPLDYAELGAEHVFDVQVEAPNGGGDEYTYNDTQFSHFTPVPLFDEKLIVRFRTNNAPRENRWELRDGAGQLVLSRGNFSANTVYVDTLDLLPGCYELMLHDSGEDGISWWANNDGVGFIQIHTVEAGLWTTLNPDFGKFTGFSFRYSNLVSVGDVAEPAGGFDLYPNPANDHLTLRYESSPNKRLHYELYNLLGERLRRGSERDAAGGVFLETIPTADLSPGKYIVVVAEGARILRRTPVTIVR